MQAVTGQQIIKIFFFEFSRVSPGAHPLTKKPEDSGYEIATTQGGTGELTKSCSDQRPSTTR